MVVFFLFLLYLRIQNMCLDSYLFNSSNRPVAFYTLDTLDQVSSPSFADHFSQHYASNV